MRVDGKTLLSVVAPARDERDNVVPLIREIEAALEATGFDYEIVFVDDASTDGTAERLRETSCDHPRLRTIGMERGSGQSAALHAGFRAVRGEIVATIDADLQNDPADLPAMIERLQASGADLVQGDRSRGRKDGAWRRFEAWVGRIFRRVVLSDPTRDSGCALRVMRRHVALDLPLEYRGMHRFFPVLARQAGYRVVEMPVRHRARSAGRTKYGTWDRAIAGLQDGLAVRWMGRGRRPVGSGGRGQGSGSRTLGP